MNKRARIVTVAGVIVLGLLLALLLKLVGVGEDQRLARVVRVYFRSWSSQDMAAYGNCFYPDAAVEFIDSSSRIHTFSLPMFLTLQRKAHEMAPVPMKEVPTDVKIEAHGDTAQVTVRWKLFRGDEASTGTDIFSMRKHDGKWRIAKLVFMND